MAVARYWRQNARRALVPNCTFSHQLPRLLTHHLLQWITCEPIELRFITDPVDASLVTGNSALGVLFDVYQEVKIYPDDEDGDSSDAVTNAQDEDDSDSDSDKGKDSGTESSEGDGGSSGGGNVGEQSSPSGPTSTSTSTSVIAPGLVLQEVRQALKQMVDDDVESSRLDSAAQPAPFPMPPTLQEWFD